MYYDIVFSLNRALWLPLLTAVNSILQNTAAPEQLRFNVIIPPGEHGFFAEKFSLAFPDAQFSLRLQEYAPPQYMRDYLDAKFKETKPERKVSRYMQYSRLFLPEIFPDLERVAYFDGDVVVIDDVRKLFAEVPEFTAEHYVGAVPHFFPCFLYFSNPLRIWGDIRRFRKSFNSGVLLTDVRFWQEETYGRLKHYLDLDRSRNYRLFQLGDETVLNLMFKEDYIMLSKRWNCCGYGGLRPITWLLRKDLQDMSVIHWSSGHHKPWRSPDIIYADIWRQYRPSGVLSPTDSAPV